MPMMFPSIFSFGVFPSIFASGVFLLFWLDCFSYVFTSNLFHPNFLWSKFDSDHASSDYGHASSDSDHAFSDSDHATFDYEFDHVTSNSNPDHASSNFTFDHASSDSTFDHAASDQNMPLIHASPGHIASDHNLFFLMLPLIHVFYYHTASNQQFASNHVTYNLNFFLLGHLWPSLPLVQASWFKCGILNYWVTI